MRLFFLILLVFPIAEIWLLVDLAQRFGWWLLAYLLGSFIAGLTLIKGERLVFGLRMMQSLGQGQNPLLALLSTARNLLAGVLLIIPGVISDVLAVLLLLIPLSLLRRQPPAAANDPDIIEAEWRRED